MAAVGCGGPSVPTSELTDTAAVVGEYAPQPGADTPASPESSQARHFHLVTRRVRHRQAGPR